MENVIFPIKEPQILSFITTDRCTAACRNCCFQCSPKQNTQLTLQEMQECIDQAVRDFPDLVTCVFTGGECTTMGADLFTIICYARKRKLKTRIVTNAHWAENQEVAYEYIKKLRDSGLNELNISTGDEHQKWIPYDRVVFACNAAAAHDIFVAVTVESTSHSVFSSQNILSDERLSKAINSRKIIVKDSLWIEFDKNIEMKKNVAVMNEGPCTNLFNTVAVSPSGIMYACCGLTCKNDAILTLGDIRNNSIRHLYDEQFDDLVKLWLYTHGPKKMNSFLCKKKDMPDDSDGYPHICSLCHHVLEDRKNMDIIKNNITDIIPTIMLKYQLINNISK